VIEYYKVDTQTIQCDLEGYSWKKGTVQVVSSKKGQVVGWFLQKLCYNSFSLLKGF